MPTSAGPASILAIDVGSKRVGVAVAHLVARLPRVLTTLNNDKDIFSKIAQLAEAEGAQEVVVGLPRGLDGQETAQTKFTTEFADGLSRHTKLTVHLQDEAVTSLLAERELKNRAKSYTKADIDALAAVQILNDYLHSQRSLRS